MPAQAAFMTSRQPPIGSGSGAKSTADEVLAGLDLGGKLAIVTGGYSGLGLGATRQAERLWALSAGLTGIDVLAGQACNQEKETDR